MALLRETKYFLLLQIPVPEAAAAVFQRADTYRTQIGSLELMVGWWLNNCGWVGEAMARCCDAQRGDAHTHQTHTATRPLNLPQVSLYNRIQRTILAVERPLVDGKLTAVEAALKRCG